MRSHEFPHLLFETIHRKIGEPPIAELPNGYYKLKYFKVGADENEPVGHIGIELLSDQSKRKSNFSRFGVWGETMYDYRSDKILDPLIEISGGPRNTGTWVIGQGNLLREEIIVKPAYRFYYYGRNLKFPLTRLIGEVLILAYNLQEEKHLPPVSYWEAFLHPEKDYQKPR